MTEEAISEWPLLGRTVRFTWIPPPFVPPREKTTQAYGICFTPEGEIVLVSGRDDWWNLPGGTIEEGETPEETLVREVSEEACARVVEYKYIGCQRVDDPQSPEALTMHYQTRFWAKVELDEFEPLHEIVERKLIKPNEFLASLSWGSAPTAKIILDEGLKVQVKSELR